VFTGAKLKIYAIGIVVFATILFSARWYYTSTQATISQLNKDLAIATQAAQDNKQAFEAQAKSNAIQQVKANDLAVKNKQAESQVNDLREMLAEHRLEYLAANKPGLLETRTNRATQKVFDQLTELSKPYEKSNTDTNNNN
jgi:hypothetical protein